MSIVTLYTTVGVFIFVLSLVCLALRPAALQRLLTINVMGIAVFLWLIAGSIHPEGIDSVPHAMVLTGIVVSVSATAFALALLIKIDHLKRSDAEGP